MLTFLKDDILLIAGDFHGNIVKIRPKNKKKFKIKMERPSTNNIRPRGVATNGKHLFISDRTEHILKYTMDGKLIAKSDDKFETRCGIAIYKDKLYVAHDKVGEIRVLDLNLNPLPDLGFGKYGKEEQEFDHPIDVAVASDGTIYVSDAGNNRIQAFENNGTFLREFGNKELKGPTAICVYKDSHILVVDYDNFRICIFTSSGDFVDNISGKFTDPTGIAVDNDGNVYTADFADNVVKVFKCKQLLMPSL